MISFFRAIEVRWHARYGLAGLKMIESSEPTLFFPIIIAWYQILFYVIVYCPR